MDNVLFCSVKDVYSQSLLGQLVELVLDNHETEYHSFSLPLLFLFRQHQIKISFAIETGPWHEFLVGWHLQNKAKIHRQSTSVLTLWGLFLKSQCVNISSLNTPKHFSLRSVISSLRKRHCFHHSDLYAVSMGSV